MCVCVEDAKQAKARQGEYYCHNSMTSQQRHITKTGILAGPYVIIIIIGLFIFLKI
jgi:hypothetical protein